MKVKRPSPPIDRALKSRFTRPSSVRSHPVWGWGVGHAFGEPDYEFPLPAHLDAVDDVTKVRIVQRYTEMTERAMLQGSSMVLGGTEVPGVAAARKLVERQAADEGSIGDIIRGNFPSGDRLRDAWTARALHELVDELTTAEIRAGVHPKELTAGGKEALTKFMLDLPTFSTYWEPRFLGHRGRRMWNGNDMRDLQPLAPAIVHCDIVVIERNWTALIGRTGRGEKYATKIIADVGKLPALLAAVA